MRKGLPSGLGGNPGSGKLESLQSLGERALGWTPLPVPAPLQTQGRETERHRGGRRSDTRAPDS